MSSEREKSDRGGGRYGGRRKSFFSLAVVVELSLILDLKACAHLGAVEVGWTCALSGRHVPRRCTDGRGREGREGDGSETCFHGVWTSSRNVWQ